MFSCARDSFIVKYCSGGYELTQDGSFVRRFGLRREEMLERLRAEGETVACFSVPEAKPKKPKKNKDVEMPLLLPPPLPLPMEDMPTRSNGGANTRLVAPLPSCSRLSRGQTKGITPPPPPVGTSTTNEDSDSEEGPTEKDIGDPQCFACDNGGELLMCDGPCCRSFHFPLNEDGADTECNPLQCPADLAQELMASRDPFECPNCLLKIQRCFSCGSMGKAFGPGSNYCKCDIISCGKFYCRQCIAQLGEPGKMFVCPLHKCSECGQGELDALNDPLIPCRRCPLAFHLGCMPEKLKSANPARVWLVKRDNKGEVCGNTEVSANFFYCEKHKCSPHGDSIPHAHPIFSKDLLRKWRAHYSKKFSYLASSEAVQKPEKEQQGVQGLKRSPSINSPSDGMPPQKMRRLEDAPRRPSPKSGSDLAHPSRISEPKKQAADWRSFLGPKPSYVAATEKELLRSMKSIKLGDVQREVELFKPYDNISRRRLTDEKLELYKRAAKRGSINSREIENVRHHMKVHLMPLLCEGRYTSFGRHFTNTCILKDIVTRIIPHLAQNDLVVDFSCGANEWLEIIRNTCTLEEMVVRFKAYDPFTPMHTRDWHRKSWLDVKQEELDNGDHLVIGLNPPFGVAGIVASKFVDHAAKFNPRLLVLIVPECTPLPSGYDIIEEDFSLCADRSFYIPGLKKESWNKKPPPFRILRRTEPPTVKLEFWQARNDIEGLEEEEVKVEEGANNDLPIM